MGWLRTLFLGDIGNRLDIGDNEQQIRSLRSRLRKARREKDAADASQDAAIEQLQEHVEQLELTIGMLSSLLVHKGLVSQDEIRQLVNSLDPPDDSRAG